MPKVTLEISDELLTQLEQIGDRWHEVLAPSLQQPVIPAHIYRYILDFLSSDPTPQQIVHLSQLPKCRSV